MSTRTARVLTLPLAVAVAALPVLVPVAAHAGTTDQSCRRGCSFILGKGGSLKIDPALEGRQVESLRANRARRDAVAVESALAELKRAAAGEANLMDPILAAARARASEGEMIAALQEVFGTYTESPVF